MDADEYQREAMRTRAPASEDRRIDLAIVGLGLTGEAGEVADLIKKHIGQGHPLDVAKLRRELGDCQWYLALAAEVIGVSLSEILEENLEKLRARYPEGFSSERSQHRPAEVLARTRRVAQDVTETVIEPKSARRLTRSSMWKDPPEALEGAEIRPLDPGFIPSDS